MSQHDHSRSLSGANDLNKQNSPARQYYADTRNIGKLVKVLEFFLCKIFIGALFFFFVSDSW